nr:phosphohydrolase [Ardenticatenia bacterium]
AVADAFDAMTSDRPYRRAMTAQAALAELERGAGTQFDPEVVDAFIQAWQDNDLASLLAGRDK